MLTEAELLAEGEIDPGLEGRVCCICLAMKPEFEFYQQWLRSPRNHMGGSIHVDTRCIACRSSRYKEQKAKQRYGLSVEQYAELRKATHCGICAEPLTVYARGGQIDHCHVTGVVRGVLCVVCNLALGVSRDDADYFDQWASRASAYLKAARVLS